MQTEAEGQRCRYPILRIVPGNFREFTPQLDCIHTRHLMNIPPYNAVFLFFPPYLYQNARCTPPPKCQQPTPRYRPPSDSDPMYFSSLRHHSCPSTVYMNHAHNRIQDSHFPIALFFTSSSIPLFLRASSSLDVSLAHCFSNHTCPRLSPTSAPITPFHRCPVPHRRSMHVLAANLIQYTRRMCLILLSTSVVSVLAVCLLASLRCRVA